MPNHSGAGVAIENLNAQNVWFISLTGGVVLALLVVALPVWLCFHEWPTKPFIPDEIRIRTVNHLKERAKEEIAHLDRAGDWEKIAQIEKARDEEIADVDIFVERFGRAFIQGGTTEKFKTALRLLETSGPKEALRFLEATSASRNIRIETQKRARDLEETELRRDLGETLLEASLLEKDLQFPKAEAEYRSIVNASLTWAEPRNQLAGLLIRRGTAGGAAECFRKLSEAIDICQGTLVIAGRAKSPEQWAETNNVLGNALRNQGKRLSGAKGDKLLHDATGAYRAALEVRTLGSVPLDWAMTENNLGNALYDQGARTEGEESWSRLTEAVDAYQAVLDI